MCRLPYPAPPLQWRHEPAAAWQTGPGPPQAALAWILKTAKAQRQSGYSFSNVLIAQHAALQIFKYDLVDQGCQYGDGEDIGHHTHHVGGFTGIGQRTAQALAETEQHLGRNPRAPAIAESQPRAGYKFRHAVTPIKPLETS